MPTPKNGDLMRHYLKTDKTKKMIFNKCVVIGEVYIIVNFSTFFRNLKKTYFVEVNKTVYIMDTILYDPSIYCLLHIFDFYHWIINCMHSLDILDIQLLFHHHNYTMFQCCSLIHHIHSVPDPYHYLYET